MTGTSGQISRHNWIYVTDSVRGDQTAHSSDIIVNISRLELLLVLEYLNF
mgnify:CR=1 FL=1